MYTKVITYNIKIEYEINASHFIKCKKQIEIII